MKLFVVTNELLLNNVTILTVKRKARHSVIELNQVLTFDV